MADTSHSFYSSNSSTRCHTRHIRKYMCRNNIRLWRYGSSKITICLIQREVISKIKVLNCNFDHLKCVFEVYSFFLSFNVHDYHLT